MPGASALRHNHGTDNHETAGRTKPKRAGFPSYPSVVNPGISEPKRLEIPMPGSDVIGCEPAFAGLDEKCPPGEMGQR